MRIKLEASYDVILIGAGIAGLVCGNFLCKKGYKVLICEQAGSPGGYVSGFKRNGFYFDAGIQSFASSGIVFPILEELNLKDRIQFVKADYRFVEPEFDVKVDSIQNVACAIKKANPGDEIGIQSYFDEISQAIEKMKNQEDTEGLKQHYSNISAEELARKHLKNCRSIGYLSQMGYRGVSALTSIGMWFSFLYDYWYPVEGMQNFANILAENIEQQGGLISYNTYVDEIIVSGSKAIGVITSSGERIESNYVVSCCDLKQTFAKLIKKGLIDAKRQQEIQSARISESFVTTYLGVDIDQDKMRKFMNAHHVFYIPDCQLADLEDLDDLDLYRKSFVEITAPSVVNASFVPDGKSSIILQALANYNWRDRWGLGSDEQDRKRYLYLKEKVGNELISTAENVIPGLSDKIIVKEIATPLTHERYTKNSEGATAGWSWNIKERQIFSRGEYGLVTPIENLYAASHWITPYGGGISTCFYAGRAVAELLDSKVKRSL